MGNLGFRGAQPAFDSEGAAKKGRWILAAFRLADAAPPEVGLAIRSTKLT